MSFFHGFVDELEKTGLVPPSIAGRIVAGLGITGATAAGLGGLAIYDHIKGKSIKGKVTKSIVTGKRLGEQKISKRYIRTFLKKKPVVGKVEIVTTEKDIRRMMKEPVFHTGTSKSDELREEIEGFARYVIEKGENAAVTNLRGESKKIYLIVPKRANINIIEHELGHLRDFGRRKYEEPSVLRELTAPVWWGSYKKTVMDPEERAWSHVKSEEMERVRKKALETYERGFHEGRKELTTRRLIPAVVAGGLVGTAIGVAKAVLKRRRFGR